MTDNGITLSDIAAVTNEGFGNGGASWWIIIFLIFAMMGGGFGLGGNAANVANLASQSDIQRAIDLNAVQQGQAGIAADIQRTTYETMNTVKDSAYNNLSEIRDTQAGINTGFANVINSLTNGFGKMQECCCSTQRAIDGVNYNAAINTAAINANTTEQVQKVLDAISGNRMADMQARINQLETANIVGSATAGVVKYPMASTYSSGANPFCNCSCNGYTL